eukprot:6018364-Alexandrium_andersonii.AAC.1
MLHPAHRRRSGEPSLWPDAEKGSGGTTLGGAGLQVEVPAQAKGARVALVHVAGPAGRMDT